ncbi:MAG: OmpH family outer membrane protein [Planctomyces sp.]
MRKLAVALAAALAVGFQLPAIAQEAARPAAKPAAEKERAPSRVGLIDMAKVFEGYAKFKVLRDELAAEIEKSDAEARVMVEKMQAMQKELQESGFQPGSAEYERAEKGLLDAKGEFEAFRAATQRKLARRESEMFKVIYADTTSMIRKYAEWAEYTVVIRFDSKDIEEDTPPAEAVQRMNKQVVVYRAENDITDIVLQSLNKAYQGSAAAGKTPARAASATAPAGTN